MALRHQRTMVGCGAVVGIWLFTGSAVIVRENRQATQPATRALARFHHIHFNAIDPNASIQFYSTRLKSEKATFAGTDALRTGKGWFLFDKVTAAVPNGTTSAFWHVGWGSADIRSLYDRLVKMGTPFETPLTDMRKIVDPRQSHYLYVSGPGQEMVEVFAETGSDDFEHVHMRAADPDAAVQWYVSHLGFPPPAPLPGMASAVPPPLWIDTIAFRFNRLGDKKTFESSRGRVLDHFAFSVDDLDQTLSRLQKEGVRIVEPARAIFGGQLRSAFIEAPDNLQVELVEDRTARR